MKRVLKSLLCCTGFVAIFLKIMCFINEEAHNFTWVYVVLICAALFFNWWLSDDIPKNNKIIFSDGDFLKLRCLPNSYEVKDILLICGIHWIVTEEHKHITHQEIILIPVEMFIKHNSYIKVDNDVILINDYIKKLCKELIDKGDTENV